jgi:hypothetical protein
MALMTGMAGLMLILGLGSDAFAQRDYYPYRDDPYRDGVYERRDYSRSHWRVQQAVAQAYRDILRREPDRSGLRQYTDAVVRRGWSIADVRRSLYRSDEYRHRSGRYYGYYDRRYPGHR